MALSRLVLAFSLLLLSLLVIASAGDASSKYGFDGIPADSPQAKPDGDASSKYGFDGIPADSPQAKPDDDASSKYGFDGIPADSPQAKPEGEEKQYYGTKPEEKENRLSVAVQGVVLCKSGSKYYPIQGALAKITCKAVDEVGVEKTLSICSGATDAKGYFFATVSNLDKLKLRECKAYLQNSPLKTCNVPTNVNKAIDGALLSAFRVLKEKRVKLYSVRPFFYTSEAKSDSNGAIARITCLAVDKYGFETAPFSFLSDATDANGYLFATLTPSEINEKLQVSRCKAFLENSPLETCKVPTDVNKGIRGALLNSYRVLNQRKMKLYWIGPFFYTSEPKSLPNGYK